MQITQERILSYLRSHPPASAGDISRYLEMTPANIRYHLDLLREEGLVGVIGTRPTAGAGRPILLYSLTASSLGENLVPLLEAILPALTQGQIEQIVENLTKGNLQGSLNRIQRFNQGVEFLDSLNYHASWEAGPQGPRVELRHCPYRDLAQTHPILCRMDEILLGEIFGSKLSLRQKRVFGKNPFSPCIFQIAEQPGEKG